MRTHVARALTLALFTLPLPAARLAAQRHAEAGRPMMRATPSQMPSIPRAPMQRDVHAAPQFESGRPNSPVPYVRDEHWYGHAAPNDTRFRLEHPYEFGRFALTGPSHEYTVGRVDLAARRIWLPGGGFEIATWDWAVTAPWCWTCDDIVVYPDPDHLGWYLLYDVRLGEYVHATFLGP